MSVEISKGSVVDVIAGPALGRTGEVFWIGPSKFGDGKRVGVRDEQGETHWMELDACRLKGETAGADRPGVPGVPDDFYQTIEDIKEWYQDNGKQNWIERLAGPATPEELESAEARLGAPMLPRLKALYLLHNGEQSGDGYWRRGFWPHGKFLDLREAIAITDEVLQRYWGCTDGLNTKPEDINRETIDTMIRISDDLSGERSMQDVELYTTNWFAFAVKEAEFTQMINLDSSRVFNFVKQDGIYFLADSFELYANEYASSLWDHGVYELPPARRKPFKLRPR